MSDSKISGLPAAAAISGLELLALVQSANSVQATLNAAVAGTATASTASQALTQAIAAGVSASSAVTTANTASANVASLTTSIAAVLAALVLIPLSGDATGLTDGAVIQSYWNTLSADQTGNKRGMALIGQYYVTPSTAPIFTTSSTPSAEGYFKVWGYGNAGINMVGSNGPIIQWKAPNTTTPHDFSIRDITLTYLTPQTSSNTLSTGMTWSSVAGNDSGGQIFMIRLDNVNVNNCWRGFGLSQTSGSFTAWGIHMQNCDVGTHTGAALYFVSPSSDGAPNISVEHCYWTPSATFSDSGAGQALCRIDACDTLHISNVEVNGQPNSFSPTGYQIFYLTGCWAHIDTCKSETTPMPAGGPNSLCTFENSVYTVENFSVQNISMGQNMVVFLCDVGNPALSKGTFKNITLSMSSTTGGAYNLTLFSGAAYPIYLDGQPNFYNLGSGPAVMRLVNSGASTTANYLRLITHPGGEMSGDIGNNAMPTFTPVATGPTGSTATPRTNMWNTPLTVNVPVNLTAGAGSVAGDNSWDGADYEIIRKPAATGSVTFTIAAASPSSQTVAVGTGYRYKYNRSLGGYVQTESWSVS